MTPKRAAAYIGGFALLAAWLASAASTSLRNDGAQTPEPPIAPPAPASTELLAADVQAHAERLRQRLASPSVPPPPVRNPFAFRARELPPPPPVRRLEPSIAEPVAAAPPAPVLVLLGIAEQQGPTGVQRTAMLADDGEQLIMVVVGQTVRGTYRVEAIGADAIELRDLATGGLRRLALR